MALSTNNPNLCGLPAPDARRKSEPAILLHWLSDSSTPVSKQAPLARSHRRHMGMRRVWRDIRGQAAQHSSILQRGLPERLLARDGTTSKLPEGTEKHQTSRV
ncbi:MAG: hypothetical protein JXB47_02845 [Anaerolineae bacterium]|nr:hypothetical protein [Anaerolineae bacterium]